MVVTSVYLGFASGFFETGADVRAGRGGQAAVLRAQLEAVRDRLADAIKREEAAEERAAEALRREREAADRLTRLIEDQRPSRGLWSRLMGQ